MRDLFEIVDKNDLYDSDDDFINNASFADEQDIDSSGGEEEDGESDNESEEVLLDESTNDEDNDLSDSFDEDLFPSVFGM